MFWYLAKLYCSLRFLSLTWYMSSYGIMTSDITMVLKNNFTYDCLFFKWYETINFLTTLRGSSSWKDYTFFFKYWKHGLIIFSQWYETYNCFIKILKSFVKWKSGSLSCRSNIGFCCVSLSCYFLEALKTLFFFY